MKKADGDDDDKKGVQEDAPKKIKKVNGRINGVYTLLKVVLPAFVLFMAIHMGRCIQNEAPFLGHVIIRESKFRAYMEDAGKGLECLETAKSNVQALYELRDRIENLSKSQKKRERDEQLMERLLRIMEENNKRMTKDYIIDLLSLLKAGHTLELEIDTIKEFAVSQERFKNLKNMRIWNEEKFWESVSKISEMEPESPKSIEWGKRMTEAGLS